MKSRRRNLHWGDLNMAERELRAILTRIEGGAHVKPAKMTVGEYLESWLRDYVATNTAPSTAEIDTNTPDQCRLL